MPVHGHVPQICFLMTGSFQEIMKPVIDGELKRFEQTIDAFCDGRKPDDIIQNVNYLKDRVSFQINIIFEGLQFKLFSFIWI